MSDNVVCRYLAGPAGTGTSPPMGSITLQNCNPPISNDETLSSFDVIGIVSGIVVCGLVAQWIMHRFNKAALNELKHGFSHLADPGGSN